MTYLTFAVIKMEFTLKYTSTPTEKKNKLFRNRHRHTFTEGGGSLFIFHESISNLISNGKSPFNCIVEELNKCKKQK